MTKADLSYIQQSKIRQLDEITSKYTYFATFAELVSPLNNYRAVLYYDQDLPNFAHRDIDIIAKAYDDHMIQTKDARRLYRA